MPASTAVTAATRRRKIVTNDPDIYATSSAAARAPSAPSVRSREDISAADLQQIKNRQEAEQLPEGQVRRKRKTGSFGY